MERVVKALTLKICQIVGYKNSGKTTLTAGLIRELKGKGKRVVSLKHHGHDEVDPLIKGDSGQHFHAGAEVAGVTSPMFAHISYETEPPIEAFVSFYRQLPEIEWLLIEGYKNAHYPKVVLVKEKNDWEQLKELSNILAVMMVNEQTTFQLEGNYHVFSFQEVSELAMFLDKESRCFIT